MKVCLVTSHPVQYQVPWIRLLAGTEGVDLTVFYCMIPDRAQQGQGFGVEFAWDVPLTTGYRYHVLKNVSSQPGFHHFRGCDTPELREILQRGKWNAVIVNGWVVKSCLQALYWCRLRRIPCIVRGESNNLRERQWWKRLIHRVLLRQYSRVLTIGEANHNFYLDNGVPKKKMFRTPYGVDNEWFEERASSSRHKRENIRERLRISMESLVFLFCGKLESKKRPMDLIAALELGMEKYPNQFKDIAVLIVGDGPLRSECENFSSKGNLAITFTGFLNQSEIVEMYVASDILVLPSDDGETWGLVVNEAMACKLPVIVSDQVGCHPDLLVEAKTGWMYPCGDVNKLTDVMLQVIKNRNRLPEMGLSAYEHVKSYSPRHVVTGCLEAFASLTNGSRERQQRGTDVC